MLRRRIPVLIVSLALAASAAFAAAPKTPGRERALPIGDEAADYTVTKIRLAAGTDLPGWKLAHKLTYDALANPVTVKRAYWTPLASALAATGPTAPESAVSWHLGKHEVLIQRANVDGAVEATFYLPSGLLQPMQGEYGLALDTNFQRQRNSTQEITTWPVALTFDVNHAISETKAFQATLFYKHTRIQNRKREAFKDENGDVIRFSDQPTEVVQDSRSAGLDLAYQRTLARDTGAGRVDLAWTAGGAWDRDRINLLEERWTPYLGCELRLASEKVDDLSMRIGLTVVESIEEFILLDPVLDANGEVVGTTERIQKTEEPSWQVVLGGRAPLYRLDNQTLILVDGVGSWLQAFSPTEGENGRPDVRERRATLQGGVTFQTPIGAALRFSIKAEYLHLPGEAQDRIDDFQWSSGFSAMLKLRW